MNAIIALDPASYLSHHIHTDERVWSQSNCYVDMLIELVHALGFDPVACLACTVAIDFEGDQWTFFKPSHNDLLTLYAMDVQELNPWNNLVDHVAVQVGLGRPVLVEVDSFFLPDTAGSAYGQAHVKTTIAVNQIDVGERVMGYFHGQGYYWLEPRNFAALWHLDHQVPDGSLPPYVEFVRLRESAGDADPQALFAGARNSLRRHIKLMPQTNPFIAFGHQFSVDLETLLQADLDLFHNYSFATLRQFGACFELAATLLQWLTERGESGLDLAQQHFLQIASTAKVFQFQLARGVARGKTLEVAAIAQMADHWSQARAALQQWQQTDHANNDH